MAGATSSVQRVKTAVFAACACAAVAGALAGCGGGDHPASATTTQASTTTPQLPGVGRPPVTIGDKNTYPEEFLLGDLYDVALVAKGYSVSLDRNIGPLEVTLQALKSGSLEMYPEYINVWDASVVGRAGPFRSERVAYAVGELYALAHQLELLTPTPFSDTGGIGVTLTYGVKHELTTIGDLRKVASTLVVGGPPQFETGAEGLGGVEQVYGFAPASFKSITVGDQYHDLDHGTIQAADVDTTDAQLASGGYLLLEDPSHVFGWGNVVPVVPQKVVEKEGPSFAATINAVSALLTTSVMRELNAEVALSHQDPKVVATEFLQAHHLVPASQQS
jgi:osmoprotectant transport system substrate-binding protein